MLSCGSVTVVLPKHASTVYCTQSTLQTAQLHNNVLRLTSFDREKNLQLGRDDRRRSTLVVPQTPSHTRHSKRYISFKLSMVEVKFNPFFLRNCVREMMRNS